MCFLLNFLKIIRKKGNDVENKINYELIFSFVLLSQLVNKGKILY